MKKRIAFHTLGCKLNFSETSSIARQFRESDFDVVDFKEEADIYVINTCSVTAMAEKKGKLAIRQAHRRNPDGKIAVVGCFSQLKPDEIKSFEGVDLVLGSNDKFDLFSIISEHHAEKPAGAVNTEFIPSFSSGDRTRSFVKIQDGCDYYCSYCTIPYARGHSRSGTIEGVLKTVSEALQQNIKEIILTGVNVGDFGRKNGENFCGLLQALDEINRIPRIRISSIEPDLLTDEIIGLVANSSRILPHFHIPLQSGSNAVLSAMKRKYPRETFESRVLKIKERMPDACIAADVIVGFPGENDALFNQTLEFIQGLPLSALHVFTYSERPGTLAAALNEKVPGEIKQHRSQILHRLGDHKKQEFYKNAKGKTVQVLFESENENGLMSGFSENYIRVRTSYKPEWVNQIVELQLNEQDEDGVYHHHSA
jgi:threonylcarbamoyladenosine tRNA methylthiotransferase MtaB